MRVGIITIACINDRISKERLFKKISEFGDFIKSRTDIPFEDNYIVILLVEGRHSITGKIAGALGNLQNVKVSTILTKDIKKEVKV